MEKAKARFAEKERQLQELVKDDELDELVRTAEEDNWKKNAGYWITKRARKWDPQVRKTPTLLSPFT